MIGQDYGRCREKWAEFWHGENHDRPLLSICAPRGNAGTLPLRRPSSLEECWTDAEYQLAAARQSMLKTCFCGEAFPVYNPNLGPDLLGAICGCGLNFGEDTSWAVPFVEDWTDLPELRFSEVNKWWTLIREMTRRALSDANGDYLVGVTDLHPGLDGLVSLRGPQKMAMDLIDAPEEIKKRAGEMFSVCSTVYRKLNAMIAEKQEGFTNWSGMWNPEADWYLPSCDFSCMISQDDFENFVIPNLHRELDLLHGSIYHLDGPGALRHLDRLLREERLGGVQWVYGAGQPTARFWLPVLQKIQNAGKLVQVNCVPEDLKDLCENLRPEGVDLVFYVESEDEAKALIRTAEEIYKTKRGKKYSAPAPQAFPGEKEGL